MKAFLLAFATAMLPLVATVPCVADARAAAKEASLQDAGPPVPVDCNPELYRMFPGVFNFCAALKQWNRGDQEEAIEYLELAAAWGDKSAQMALGVAYFNGNGAPRDRALGLAWLALAVERQDPKAAGLYLSALGKVDASERQRADVLYRRMRAKYADEVAAVRADRQYRRQLRALRANPAYGAGTCIAGLNARGFSRPKDAYSDPGNAIEEKSNTCSMASEHAIVEQLERRYEVYFKGWRGRATVGSPKQLEPPGEP